jgi:hypothetical protein
VRHGGMVVKTAEMEKAGGEKVEEAEKGKWHE